MTDEVTAQRILQDWATARGWGTTLTVDKKMLYFHYDRYNGFATIDFTKSPAIKLSVSNKEHPRGVRGAFWASQDGWSGAGDGSLDEYDLNLAEENVLRRIERILERTIDSYLED